MVSAVHCTVPVPTYPEIQNYSAKCRWRIKLFLNISSVCLLVLFAFAVNFYFVSQVWSIQKQECVATLDENEDKVRQISYFFNFFPFFYQIKNVTSYKNFSGLGLDK